LPPLAIGFVGAHLAVTSVIIGPRTQEQLAGLLTATDLELPRDVLDRIDEIVPSGTDLADDMYTATLPALSDKALRRRFQQATPCRARQARPASRTESMMRRVATVSSGAMTSLSIWPSATRSATWIAW
jgi:hypothetical protein